VRLDRKESLDVLTNLQVAPLRPSKNLLSL
jgi:hypothetical protein